MASKAHQFIAELVARKMILDGYEVISFEGYSENEQKISLPPKIKRHRPDLIGMKSGSLAIGEAKTADDFGTRTHEQLEDFISAQKDVITDLKIYLGFPISAENRIQGLVGGVSQDGNILLLPIPDRLLPE